MNYQQHDEAAYQTSPMPGPDPYRTTGPTKNGHGPLGNLQSVNEQLSLAIDELAKRLEQILRDDTVSEADAPMPPVTSFLDGAVRHTGALVYRLSCLAGRIDL